MSLQQLGRVRDPTKIDRNKSRVPTYSNLSNLEDLAKVWVPGLCASVRTHVGLSFCKVPLLDGFNGEPEERHHFGGSPKRDTPVLVLSCQLQGFEPVAH